MRLPRRTVLVLAISVTVIASVSGLANAGSANRDATMRDGSPARFKETTVSRHPRPREETP
jgi:hypothetical protein